ncbi:MAG: hypothetical protein ACXAEU_20605 [Candidatus Hodarchaeales archaeon]|jgi:hypothetical protein
MHKRIKVKHESNGINKENVETTTVTRRNTGYVFSRIISHYRKGAKLVPPPLKKVFKDQSTTIETIENIEELRISKGDLLEAGKGVKYFFRFIDNLIFEDDCDNQTLLDHVLTIRNCNVKMPETVSNLLFYSLVRQKPKFVPDKDDLKDITIRNVIKEAYDEFATACQLNNQRIGEAVNELFWHSVSEMEGLHILLHNPNANPIDTLIVSSLEKLEVTAKDLNEIKNRSILFHRIKKLVFAPDIDKDKFTRSVVGIYNCDEVELPETIPKLLRISRVKKYPN